MSVFVNGWAQKKLRRALFTLWHCILFSRAAKSADHQQAGERQHGPPDLAAENWRQQCQEKKAQAKGWRQWLEEEMGWQVPDGEFWQDKKFSDGWPVASIAGLV